MSRWRGAHEGVLTALVTDLMTRPGLTIMIKVEYQIARATNIAFDAIDFVRFM